ncbi:MAG: hypothetical protein KGK08_15070, partial [Acidobacteriota bacterium]|nr:hypothetical protein [Acidobacteriota bacterium]
MQSPQLANSPIGQKIQRLFHGSQEAVRASVTASQLLRDSATADPEIALRRLRSSADGLLDREAAERLEESGPNTIAHEHQPSVPAQLLHHFWNPLNILLVTLSGLSVYLGDYDAATIIALMVTLSVMLSFVQEFRSNNAAARLRAMVSTTATVLRKDRRSGVPEEVNRYF